jgi:type IV pilus assembly protein PilY1
MNRHPRLLASLIATAALLLPGAAGVADDSAFFSARVPPNVVIIMDTSGSMRIMVQHPYFDSADAPFVMSNGTTCDALPLSQGDTDSYPDEASPARNVRVSTSSAQIGHRFELRRSALSDWTATPTTSDDPDQGYVLRTFCGHERKLYTDPNVDGYGHTWWLRDYLNWYFHLEPTRVYSHPDPTNPETKTGAEIIAEIEDANSGRDYVTGAPAPEYQVARMTAAQRVAKEIMYRTNTDCPAFGGDCGVYEDRVRFGIARFRGGNGGYVVAAPADYTISRASLESSVDALQANGSTPLGETLYQIYTFFMKRGTATADAADRPDGLDNNALPAYRYRLDGSFTTASDYAADPVLFDCQRQFVIFITDGEPNGDNFTTSGDVTQGFSSFRDQIGDYAPDLASENDWNQSAPAWSTTDPSKEEGSAIWGSSSGAGYLDDIALFMQDHDLRGDIPDTQVVDVYTVGFTTSGAVNTLLEKTARNGNGLFFEASVGGELANALSTALQSVIEKSQSFTAATVPASRATDGNNFFVTYFDPSATNPYWAGHLKLFEFNALGEIRDKRTATQIANGDPGTCALDDPVVGRCQSGPLRLELDGYWDAAEQVPPASEVNGRKLLVSKVVSGSSTAVNLTQAQIDAADLGLGVGTDVTQWAKFGNDLTNTTTAEELTDAIVRHARGCEFQDGACVDRGPNRKLHDIFHSNPVVVGPPNAGLRHVSYREFLQRYQHRKRVIFAGSNGGFVHGFNTGEYGTAQVPAGYDRGTGVEEFGFMPYPARLNLPQLSINGPRTQYYVDAPPTAADVWLDPTRLVDIENAGNWNSWRTVLVGGMREGGNVVYALDVTNPPDHNSASGEQATGPAYPSYLWEFPCENQASADCSGTGFLPTGRTLPEYRGQSWSEPIVTRVRVTVNCDEGDVGCVVEDRWVAIFGGGYDTTSDPNLPHNSTDASTSTAADYDSSDNSNTSRKGRAIFMVDVATGKVLAMRHFGHSSGQGEPEMAYAFTATPAVFDLDFDGYADVAYFGDLGGNLWKWAISDSVRDPIHGVGDVFQPNWKFFKIFTAQDCVSGCSPVAAGPPPHYRSFFAAPTGALVGSKLWLTWGSGERKDLGFVGTTAAERNRYYVMVDKDPLERGLTLPSSPDARYTDVLDADLVNADSLDLTAGCSNALPADKVGFYIEGIDGEKFITDSAIFFGVVLTGSFVPTNTPTVCDSSGEGFLYGFDLFCGEGIFPPPASNPTGPRQRSISVGGGLPTQPRVSVGPVSGGGGGGGGPCADMVVIITSEGDTYSECPGGRPGSGVRVNSWRDR